METGNKRKLSKGCPSKPHLVIMKRHKNRDNTSSYNLFKPSIERCEFCDKVFENKYTHLIHNAKHIIIPLLNQSFYQCEACLYHFISQDDLNDHIACKHPEKNPELHAVKTECQVKVEPLWFHEEELPKYDSRVTETVTKNDSSSDYLNREPLMEPNTSLNIKSRIVFEDDDIISQYSKSSLDDVTNEWKVEVEYLDESLENADTEIHQDAIDCMETETNGISEETGQAVHYDDLVKGRETPCRCCGKIFSNRYDLIKHETSHMRFRRPRALVCPHCDRYIDGNGCSLRQHIKHLHPNFVDYRRPLLHCSKCGLLFYQYFQHIKNYHEPYLCPICGKKFYEEECRDVHLRDHDEKPNIVTEKKEWEAKVVNEKKEWEAKVVNEKKEWESRIVKVCDMCLLFMKSKQNAHYVQLGIVNQIGVRHTCEKCCNKFFEVNLVKSVQKLRYYSMDERKKKPLSNKDRLKNIQHRLKRINMLNKK